MCEGCPSGYTREGCGGDSPGRCVPVTCVTPPSVKYATYTVAEGGVFPKGKVIYQCNAGYTRTSGDASFTCGADKQWKGTAPTCTGVPCQTISVTDTLSVQYTNNGLYPSTASFACAAGHFMSGDSSLTCLTSGAWSATKPICHPVSTAQDVTVECSASADAEIAKWLDQKGQAGVPPGIVCDDKPVMWSHDFSEIRKKLNDGCGGNTGSGEVTFTGTDNCQHEVKTKATVTIEDTRTPTIKNAPKDTAMSCSDKVPLAAPTLLASDECDSTVEAVGTQTRKDGDCSSRYTLINVWTATDACQNTETAMQTIVVTDNDAPTLQRTAQSKVEECDMATLEDSFAAWVNIQASAAATDSCTQVTWTHEVVSEKKGCGATVDRQVTFTASDDCGQSVSTTAMFTVTDRVAPRFQQPAATLQASCSNVPEHLNLTATDACSAVEQQKQQQRIDGSCVHHYGLLRFWVLSDDCGNTARVQQLVAVSDTQAPSIKTPAGDLVVNCDRQAQQAQIDAWLNENGNAVADDDCSSEVTWSHNFFDVADQLKVGCGYTGKATVTFTATDECGNKATTTATVEVRDISKPTFSALAQNKSVECDGEGNMAELQAWVDAQGGAVAADACSLDSQLTWTHEMSSMSLCGEAERKTYTFTVTDACGQSSTSVATFSIIDSSKPTLKLAGDNPQEVEAYFAWVDPGLAGIVDACHKIPVSVSTVSGEPNTNMLGHYNVSYTASDPCGAEGTVVRRVWVRDTLAPRIVVDGPKTIVLRQGAPYADHSATAADYPASSPSSVTLFSSAYSYTEAGIVQVREGDSVEDVAQQAGEHYIFYTALDEENNHAEQLARVLLVLNGDIPGRGKVATWRGIVDASASFGIPSGASAAAPLAHAFSFIVASDDPDEDNVRAFLNGTGLPMDLNMACFPDMLPGYTRCVASSPIVTKKQLLALQRKVVGVSTVAQPVVGFAGTIMVAEEGSSLSDRSFTLMASTLLAQQGINTVNIAGCVQGLCFFDGADAPSSKGFTVPVVAPSRLFWVTVRSATSSSPAFVLSALSLRGIVPSYFDFKSGAGTVAHRGLYDLHDFTAAGLTVETVTVTGGFEITLRVSKGMSKMAVRAALLAAAIVPHSLEWSGAGDNSTRPVEVATYSELAGLAHLLKIRGIEALDSVSPLPTQVLPSAEAAGRYQYEIRVDATVVDTPNATFVVQTVLAALEAVKIPVSEPRIIEGTVVRFGSDKIVGASTIKRLETLAEISAIVRLSDMFDEISAGLRSVIDRVLPVDPARVKVRAEPLPPSGFDKRRAAVGFPVELEVVVDIPTKRTSGLSYYQTSVRMKPSSTSTAADAKALRIFEELKVGFGLALTLGSCLVRGESTFGSCATFSSRYPGFSFLQPPFFYLFFCPILLVYSHPHSSLFLPSASQSFHLQSRWRHIDDSDS